MEGEVVVDVADQPPWLVRIEGRRVGAGVLVSERHVVTCAHVVGSDPDSTPLEITFPFVDVSWKGRARILVADPAPGDDVAVLEMMPGVDAELLPPGARPAPFTASMAARGHRYRAYGYPSRSGPPGGWSYGTVAGSVGRNRLQLDRDPARGYPIVPGFSGGPIWDDHARAVIGIVDARDRDPDEGIQVGFGLSSEVVQRHLAAAGIATGLRGASLVLSDSEGATAGPHATEMMRGPPPDATSGLPFPHEPLIDRDREMSRAIERLKRDGVRLLTLTGPGGVGKSRLAIQVAWQLRGEVDSVRFVDLTVVREPSFVLYELAARLSVSAPAYTPLLTAVKVALREPRTLLLLDNFEHLLEAAPLLVELLESAPQLQLLVTSRVRLRVLPEHALAVHPMQLPAHHSMPPEEILKAPAVAIFVRRAVAIDDAFRLTQDNAATIVDICARLDGLPLAMELAAARMKLLGPRALLARLSNRLDLLTEGMRDRPSRQQSLRATLEWSYRLLPLSQRKVFGQLAVFAGGCTAAAAEAVCGLPPGPLLDSLAALMDNSLLNRSDNTGTEPRYQMLETVREYAESVLVARGSEADARARHARWCVEMAEDLCPDSGHDQLSSVSTLDRESANVRAALGWLRRAKELELALRLAAAIAWYWELRSHFDEGRDWLDGLMADIDTTGQPVPEVVRAQACYEAALLAYRQGAYAHAVQRCEESLRHARAAAHERRQAWALYGLAVLRRERGEVAESFEAWTEAQRLFERTGDRRGLASTLYYRAVVHFYRGDFELSRSAGEESLRLFREVGHSAGAASVMTTVGLALHYAGDNDRATVLLEDGLALRRALGDQRGAASLLNNLALIALDRGDHALALSDLTECATIKQRLGDRAGYARALSDSGLASQALGDHRGAMTMLERALAICRGIGDRRSVARSLRNLASIHLSSDKPERAAILAAEALMIFEELGDLFDLARTQQLAAEVAERSGHLGKAVSLLLQAAVLFGSLGTRLDTASCLGQLAELALSDSRTALAVSLTAVADRLREQSPSPPQTLNVELQERVLDVARRGLRPNAFNTFLASLDGELPRILTETFAMAAEWEERT